MDSLRYWVTEMHVDGFRFDLAATPGPPVPRGRPAVRVSSICPAGPGRHPGQAHRRAVGLGEGGYQVGNFPALWSEWNGKYRDSVRDFWRGEPRHPRRARLTANGQRRPVPGQQSTPGFQHQLRHRPRRVHAGDLVSYNEKHNEANGEDRRPMSHNRSWNCGVGARHGSGRPCAAARQQRNFIATFSLAGRAHAARRR